MEKIKRSVRWFGLLMLIAASVQAQILTPVKWKINLEDSEEAEKTLTFTATINRGWHIYDMNLPKGGPISTSIKYEKLKGAELVGKPTASVRPTVTRDEVSYPGLELRWYSNSVTFTQKIRVTDPKAFKMVGEVEFMACNDESCLPPETESFTFDRKHVARTKQAAEPAATDGSTDAGSDVDNADTATDDRIRPRRPTRTDPPGAPRPEPSQKPQRQPSFEPSGCPAHRSDHVCYAPSPSTVREKGA